MAKRTSFLCRKLFRYNTILGLKNIVNSLPQVTPKVTVLIFWLAQILSKRGFVEFQHNIAHA